MRKRPEATGYSDRLYELSGLNGELAQQVETKFFQPVDTAAAEALEQLEQSGGLMGSDLRLRSGWSRFLLSLLLRMPEDLEVFKKSWLRLMRSDNIGEWEERYRLVKGPNSPSTFADAMDALGEDVHSRQAMRVLMGFIDNPRVGATINNMLWGVLNTDPDDCPLLTSDRPVIRTNGLHVANAHLALPIGPHRLFVAVRDQQTLECVLSANPRQVVREVNRQVCQYAHKYVYGVDDRQIEFVKKHFAVKPQPRLLASASARQHEMEQRMLQILRSSESEPKDGGC